MENQVIRGLLLFLIGCGGGFVQRVSGFGLGIFVMLFLPYLMPTHTAAAAISCLFSCGTSSWNAVKFRRQIPFRTVLPLLGAAMVTIPVAVYFSAQVSGQTFKLILGCVLILLGMYFLRFARRVRIRPTVPSGLAAGAVSGVLNGLFSTGGPPAVLYMTHAAPDNAAYFAGIQFYFAMTNIYATAMRIIGGTVTWGLLGWAAVGFAGCMLGDRIGGLVFDRLDGAALKRIIYIGMMISGLLMLRPGG